MKSVRPCVVMWRVRDWHGLCEIKQRSEFRSCFCFLINYSLTIHVANTVLSVEDTSNSNIGTWVAHSGQWMKNHQGCSGSGWPIRSGSISTNTHIHGCPRDERQVGLILFLVHHSRTPLSLGYTPRHPPSLKSQMISEFPPSPWRLYPKTPPRQKSQMVPNFI